MNFFKKTSVALVIALLVVALCCVWGHNRASQQTPEIGTHYEPDRSSGESNLNYYLGWISDSARLFSADTVDTLARENLTLDNTYGSLVAVKTVSYLNGRDIQSYAEETARTIGLDRRDMLLFLDSNSESWYVTYGSDLVTYVETSADLPNLFRKHLGNAFWEEGNADKAIQDLFRDLEDWYEENIPPLEKSSTGFLPAGTKVQSVSLGSILSGILFTLLANLWWIALAFIALNIVDRIRFDKFYEKQTNQEGDEARFHPFLFWHRPGSNWYEDRMEEALENYEEVDEELDPAPAEDAPQGEEVPSGERSLSGQVWDLFRTLTELIRSAFRPKGK
ncbi:MAG: TPM domain-containing protein [Ruminiclostridium sp.]|nr:TPM domain-containing protein [Ruminiclostridium sp.]